jgi:serine protein kinase
MTKENQKTSEERLEELKNKVILSLGEWRELVKAYPSLIRNAPEYILDALDYWGIEKFSKFGKTMMSFKALSMSPKNDERLIGHEQTQTKLYQVLKTLCRNNSKMILLVGPNGSAKSTLWNALSYSLEAYSKQFEGSRYSIEWIFPYAQTFSRRMGFSHLVNEEEDGDTLKEETFAFMDDQKIERIRCDANCNPALLYTPEAKKKYFGESQSKLLEDEELCPKCYIIIKELLEIYKTKNQILTNEDPDDILMLISRHIRIKKMEISKVYQEGIAVIDPNTDPRSITMKERVPYYMKKPGPEILKNISEKLPEFDGPLSKAANGLLIMEDSLESILSFINQFLNDKRKLNISGERFKLDVMLVGSINPEKLNMIKENPEFNRFISRLEIIYVPYLIEYTKEAKVYKIKVDDLRKAYHIAPHTEELFALFSIMTRLKPVMSNKNYEKDYEEHKRLYKLKGKLKGINLLQKAKMYDHGEMPKRTADGEVITVEEQEIIADNLDAVYNEWSHEEGRGFGISYREVDAIIDRALMESHSGFLSPISLMNELKYIIKTESQDYPFLQGKNNLLENNQSYLKLIDYLDQEYFNIINQEMRDVFELDFRQQIVSSLESYIFEGLRRVLYEKGTIKNKGGADITQSFLETREQTIFGHVLDHKQRENLWFKYAGEADHQKSGEENINKIFSAQIKEAHYRIYTEKKVELAQNLDDILIYLEDGKLGVRTEKEIQKVKESIEKLYERGYNKDSAKELVGYLKGNLDRLVEPKKP